MEIAVVVDGVVIDRIEAEASDPVNGLIGLPPDSSVAYGWLYDDVTQTFTPRPMADPALTVTDQRIIDAPDSLFGGPTIKEVFDVHHIGD